MQEFSSVIASSYDAESLAPMLTDKAADGWSVVSIVSAGTNVVAYLTRGGAAGGGATTATAPAAIVGVADVSDDTADRAVDDGVPMAADSGALDDATIATPEPVPATDFSSDTSSSESAPDSDQSGWGADQASSDAPAPAADAAQAAADDQFSDGMGAVAGGAGIVADTGDMGGAAMAGADLDDSEASSTTTDAPLTSVGSSGTADQGDATTGLAGGIADDTPTDDDADRQESSDPVGGAAEHAGTPPADPGDASSGDDSSSNDTSSEATAPADASGVPAGWYADPSGRYELRYWDGAAWTEHVSRAGQQYTDPPVA